MSQNTKIEWTDITWNPVWGCNGGCKYCYARGIAKRFAKQIAIKEMAYEGSYGDGHDEYWLEEKRKEIASFKPTHLPSNFLPFFPNKSKHIFVGSMSDIAFWLPNWIKDIIYHIKAHPQHKFQILTKFPKKIKHIEFPDNVWLGITAETQKDLVKRFTDFIQIKAGKHFISFEPLHAKVDMEMMAVLRRNIYFNYEISLKDLYTLDWVIIGVQTGHNRKPTKLSWIENIVEFCKKLEIPVFIKSVEINNKVIKDIKQFPEHLQLRQFPK